jgi:acetyl esterase/lipase
MSIAIVRQMLEALIGGPDTPFMERRAQAEAFAGAFVMPDGVRAQADHLGGVPVEWIVPDGADEDGPVLFHLHGGGYVLGNPAGSRPFTTAFARESLARVVSVDYRLAPEHPFPAAVDDALRAYRALLALGYEPGRLAVGGESAGGGLTVAMLLAARDEGLAMPACAFAISPWVDMTCRAGSFATQASTDPMLTRRSLKEMAEAYLAGAAEEHPLASPLFGDLAGLPPLLVHVGSEEVLLDDSIGLHARATASGVDCDFAIWDGMIHVWHMFHALLPEGGRAICEIAAFTRKRWSGQ